MKTILTFLTITTAFASWAGAASITALPNDVGASRAVIDQNFTNLNNDKLEDSDLATIALLEAMMTSTNIIVATEIDSVAEFEALLGTGIATQAEIDLKADLASPALTGNPTAPNQTTGDSDTSIANTAFVQQEIGAITSVDIFVNGSTASGNPLNTDHSYSGFTHRGDNGGEAIDFGETVYWDFAAGEWLIADASDERAEGICVDAAGTTDGNPITVLYRGLLRDDSYAFVAGDIYLSATAGAVTQTAPSTAGDTIQIVGWAKTADIAFFSFTQHTTTKN